MARSESTPAEDHGLSSGLPRVALGCGNFGGIGSSLEHLGQGLSEDESFVLMDVAWELGITHFDTADAYGGGRSEQAIGRWIRSRGLLPTLTTKTFNPMAPGADSGLAPARIERQFGESLERLGVDRVPPADSLATLSSLRDAGRIGAYGVSNWNATQLRVALSESELAAVQNGYSLLAREDEAEVLPLCAENGLAYLVYSPLCGGWLTGKYRRGQPYPEGSRMTQRPGPYGELAVDRTFDALEALEAFAADRERSMAGAALAWLLADERVSQVVIGPGRPEHLDPLREALERPLAPSEREQLTGMFD
jgi:aryl-alcohol dehydrogenase-like predicted oxidoreductase